MGADRKLITYPSILMLAQQKREEKKPFFPKLRIPPHQFCLLLLRVFAFLLSLSLSPSPLTHTHASPYQLTDNSHTCSRCLTHRKILHPFSLTRTHLLARRFSPLSFSHTTCASVWVYVCVCVCVFVLAQRRTHFFTVWCQEEAEKYSHIFAGKSFSEEIFAKNERLFTSRRRRVTEDERNRISVQRP